MSQQPETAEAPPTTRQLRGPDALALADLTAIFDDLQFVLGACERLLGELTRGPQQDAVVAESLWAATLTTYARCFRSRESGVALSVTDLSETGVKGEVVQWHQMLGRLRNFLVDGVANPREEYFVGVSQAADGVPVGIVVTSIARPKVDETTVRQTGRLAFELSSLVDTRIKERQEAVFAAARKLSAAEFDKLDPIDVDWSPAQEEPASK
ncbi:MAG TPA: hypothetical protein VHZ97_29305 [Pseudonocardiaceae bacterium]|jgi:hypothetical protein|nr:hypothetical protein [Pseudonocardiaceae bacterium]